MQNALATVTRRDAKRALATLCGRVKCCGALYSKCQEAAVTHTATAAVAGITKTTIRMNSVNDAFCDWQLESGRGIEKGRGEKEE